MHAILASIEDDREPWTAVNDPPLDERTGRRRWTAALAQRRVGHSTRRPESVAEKVNAIHDLACDEQVAVAAAKGADSSVLRNTGSGECCDELTEQLSRGLPVEDLARSVVEFGGDDG